MKIAAVDIGSNAIRLFIAKVELTKDKKINIEKLAHTRIPIRLGEDVFTFGRISNEKVNQLADALMGFKYIVKSLAIEHFQVCATSALRTAENRDSVVKRISQETGISIKILTGSEEASLIYSNFELYELPQDRNYLFIDVGGGSTELTIIENNEKKISQSFEIGTVRMLLNDQVKIPAAILKWLKSNLTKNTEYEGIATGGNINSAFKILEKKQKEIASVKELIELKSSISKLSKTQRMNKFRIREDRADVLLPALNIYTQIASAANIETLVAPKFGLADGIVLNEFKNNLELV
jgi:exopolyphosphatase / guanosine-5'-triphosphate,3'-diphosphate pyrophosphatase